jgi:hypothetical protein
MNQGQIRVIVALIVLGGHFVVFVFGLLLGVFGPLTGVDTFQTILMTSPVLGMIAASAVNWVTSVETGVPQGDRVSLVFSIVVIFFPSALICCIGLVFALIYLQTPNFGPGNMKIAIGGIETFFGLYIGAISDRLFGKREQKAT